MEIPVKMQMPTGWTGNGNWAFLQVLNAQDFLTVNGTTIHLTANGKSLLDKDFPLSNVRDSANQQAGPLLPVDSKDYKFFDSPHTFLSNPYDYKDRNGNTQTGVPTWADADDTFHLYVMFKPDGGTWVPLKLINWHVRLQAYHVAGGGGQYNGWFLGGYSNPTVLSQQDAPSYPDFSDKYPSSNTETWEESDVSRPPSGLPPRKPTLASFVCLAATRVRFAGLALVGLACVAGISLTTLALFGLITSRQVTICKGSEIGSHRGGVSVWRKISLPITDHRVVLSIATERSEDRSGRPIRTSALHRKLGHQSGGKVQLFAKPAPAFDACGIRYEDFVSLRTDDWAFASTTVTVHAIVLFVVGSALAAPAVWLLVRRWRRRIAKR
jgi:hypothetical protein